MRRRPRSAPWARERPSLTAERGLRGDAPRSRSRIEEPRGSRSAASEVELPPRCPQSRAPPRASAGGKVTPAGSRCRPRDRTPQKTGALATTAASFPCSEVSERTRSPAGRHRLPLLGGASRRLPDSRVNGSTLIHTDGRLESPAGSSDSAQRVSINGFDGKRATNLAEHGRAFARLAQGPAAVGVSAEHL